MKRNTPKRCGLGRRSVFAGSALTLLAPVSLGASEPESPPMLSPARPAEGPACAKKKSSFDGPQGIHLSSGEFVLEVADLCMPSVGMDFRWVRTYRSQSQVDRGLGHGWTHSYDLTVQVNGADRLVTDGTGRLDRYEPDGSGHFAHNEFSRQLEELKAGGYKMTFPNGAVWTYGPADALGESRIASSADRHGNTMTFDYNADGTLQQVVDTQGRVISVGYDATAQIGSLADSAGRVVTYGYGGAPSLPKGIADPTLRLTSVTTPEVVSTPNGNDFPGGLTTTYTYSGGFGEAALNHNLLASTDPSGQIQFANEYVTNQNSSHPEFDRLATHSRIAGSRVDLSFQSANTAWGGSPGSSAAYNVVIVNDEVGNVSEHYYDSDNRRRILRQFTGRANPQLPTTATTNRPQNPLRSDDPALFETRWDWNSAALMTQEVLPNGNIRQWVYEIDRVPSAGPLTRANLLETHRLPGTHPTAGAFVKLSEFFEYGAGLGACCGSEFVTKHIDAKGNVRTYSYDNRGNLVQSVDAIASVVTDMSYDQQGRLIETIHPDNGSGFRRVDRLSYYPQGSGASSGQLSAETIDATGTPQLTRFVYDIYGTLQSRVTPRGHVYSTTFNALGQLVESKEPTQVSSTGTAYRVKRQIWWDTSGHVVSTEVDNYDHQGVLPSNPTIGVQLQHDVHGRLTMESTEANQGHWITERFTYDPLDNVVLHKRGEAVNGSQPDNVTAYVFDERNLLFKSIYGWQSSAQTTRRKDYDNNGNVRTIIIGLEGTPTTRSFVYDGFDILLEETQRDGTRLAFKHDKNRNVVQKTFRGRGQGAPVGSAPVVLSSTVFGYDALDRRTSSDHAWVNDAGVAIDDGWMSRSTTWTDLSDVESTVDDRGTTFTHAYDTSGRPALSTDSSGNSQSYEYDLDGNMVKLVTHDWSSVRQAHDSYTSTTSYDALGRVARITDPLMRDELFDYDSLGNETLHVSRRGNETRTEYDGAGRPLSTAQLLTDTGDGTGSLVGSATSTFTWDDSDRLVSTVDSNGQRTRYAYDELGRRLIISEPDGTLSQVGTGASWPTTSATPNLTNFTSGYDTLGNPIKMVDANGTVLTNTFNPEGRRTTTLIAAANSVSSTATFEVFEYDGLGRITKARDNDATAIIRYDSASNVIRDQVNGVRVTALHDGNGQLKTLVYPSGRQIDHILDLNSNLLRVKEGSDTLYAALTLGVFRTEKEAYGNGTSSLRAYGGDRQITSLKHFAPNGTSLISSLGFAWDGEGNKTVRSDALGFARSVSLTYDSLNQLKGVVDLGGVSDSVYTLDTMGNRTSVTGGIGAGAYTMNASLPSPADAQQNQYSSTPLGLEFHNDNGSNIITKTNGDYWRLVRDGLGRVVSAKNTSSAHEETYRYDALGRRLSVESVISGVTTRRNLHYYGNRLLEERDADSNTVATYVHGQRIDQIVSMSRGPDTYFFHSDDQNSTVAVSDTAGTVVERYEYSDYGAPSIMDGSGGARAVSAIGNRFLFTGREYEAATGLYYYRARYMNPVTGRFVDRDPLGKWGDAMNRGNALTYASANPYSYVDPYGTTTVAGGDGIAWVVRTAIDLAIEAATGNAPPEPKGEAPSGTGLEFEFTESQKQALAMAQRAAELVCELTTDVITAGAGKVAKAVRKGWDIFKRTHKAMDWIEDMSQPACAYSVSGDGGKDLGYSNGDKICLQCKDGKCSGTDIKIHDVEGNPNDQPKDVLFTLKPNKTKKSCHRFCDGARRKINGASDRPDPPRREPQGEH